MAQATRKKRKPRKTKAESAAVEAAAQPTANDSADKEDAPKAAKHISTGLREGVLFLLLAVSAYILVSIFTYSPADPSWSQAKSYSGEVANAGGVAGAWLADIMLVIFGYVSYLFPIMIAYLGIWLYQWRQPKNGFDASGFFARVTGCILSLVSGTTLFSMHIASDPSNLPASLHDSGAGVSGGVLGQTIALWLIENIAVLGASLLSLTLFLTGITLFTALSWLNVFEKVGRSAYQAAIWFYHKFKGTAQQIAVQHEEAKSQKAKRVRKVKEPRLELPSPAPKQGQIEIKSNKKATPKSTKLSRPKLRLGDGLPPLDLLDPPVKQESGYSRETLELMSQQLETVLSDFNIDVKVVSVHPGPVITRFEIEPAPGVKVSQISNLSKDVARALSVVAVRVVEIIAGKSTMGLEIPNEKREIVYLREILQSADYSNASASLTLALGKDIAGNTTVANLGKMPHLLIAGTTGSGKSVGINTMILSLLYKTSPEDVRMIMIDPKMLELSVYEGIPHLLSPVVTDMKEASNALRWCVAEMERRYQLMAALGVRNIEGANKKIRDALKKGKPLNDPLYRPPEDNLEAEIPTLESLPYIVVIIDELADMMMIVGKKVEELIARLAQKARASGIHLILATQRPSVDVITGLIKANIPTRIAFQVSSRVDSRTILDQMGAENLLGHGDMLYMPPGTGLPMRVHGAFVADNEVHRVVDHWKSMAEPDYLEEILQGGAETASLPGMAGESSEEMDPLYDEAVQFVTQTRKASISGVQRKLKVGYNRAARMVEEMEASGVVGPLQSNGSREVIAPAPPKM